MSVAHRTRYRAALMGGLWLVFGGCAQSQTADSRGGGILTRHHKIIRQMEAQLTDCARSHNPAACQSHVSPIFQLEDSTGQLHDQRELWASLASSQDKELFHLHEVGGALVATLSSGNSLLVDVWQSQDGGEHWQLRLRIQPQIRSR